MGRATVTGVDSVAAQRGMIVDVAEDDVFMFPARPAADRSLVVRSKTSLREAKEQTKELHDRMEERFRAAPFPLYGLPPSWIGGRYLGGGEWGTDRGQERIRALSLVHGVLVRGDGQELIVETSSPQSVGGGWLANAAGMVWSGFSSSIEEAVAEVHPGDPIGRQESLPAPARAGLNFDVDGAATSFDVFLHDDEWVARAEIRDHWLTVEGRPFDPADVTLVRIQDIDPYILGTRQFNERRG